MRKMLQKRAKTHVFWGGLAIVCLVSILPVSLTACNNPANSNNNGKKPVNPVEPKTPEIPENPVFPPIIGVSGWPVTIANESFYGTVIADRDAAQPGDTVILTIKPSGGYRLDELSIIAGYELVDYAKLGSDTCAFIMPNGAVKIGVSFATMGLNLHNITVNSTANGAIVADPAEIQRETAAVTLSAQAASGYKINPASIKVTSGGQSVPIVQNDAVTFTFAMPAGDAAVNAAFVPQSTTLQTITVTAAANGVIGVPLAAQAGDVVELALFPNSGYRYKEGSLTVSGASPAAPGGDSIRKTSFTMPGQAVTIGAQFEEIPAYAVNVTVKGLPDRGSFAVLPIADGSKDAVQLGKTAILILNIPDRFEYRYKANSFAITGGGVTAQEALSGRIWTFTMPNQAVSAEAEVEIIPFAAVTKGTSSNGTVIISGLKPDGTAPQGATVTIQGLPDPGYKVNGNPTVTPAIQLTPDGPNKWRFTMGLAALSVTMDFTALDSLAIYSGGLNPAYEPTWIEEGQNYYGGRVVVTDNIDINAATEGRNGNTRAIRIYRSTTGPGSGRGEIALAFNAASPVKLQASNVKALSFWIKDARSAENRFEFYGLGNVGDASEKAMRTRNRPDNTNTVADTWKQFVVPIPPMTKEHEITRVFFIKFDLDSGDSLLIDDIELITDYVGITQTVTGVVISDGDGSTTTTQYVYEGHSIHADAILLDRLWVALGDFRLRFSDW